MAKLVMLITLSAVLIGCESSPVVFHGDSNLRVVVGPLGKESVLDGTGRYIGDAAELGMIQRPAPRPIDLVDDPLKVESHHNRIALVKEGGTYKVPVLINNVLSLRFTVDSGAADVNIPADVVMTLIRTGTIRPDDFLGTKTYRLADGSTVPSRTFRIRSLRVGDKVVENVAASMGGLKAACFWGKAFSADSSGYRLITTARC